MSAGQALSSPTVDGVQFSYVGRVAGASDDGTNNAHINSVNINNNHNINNNNNNNGASSCNQPIQQQQQQQQQHSSPHQASLPHHYTSPLVSSFPNIIGPELPCKYRLRKFIGRGAYSTVWSLIDNRTGVMVVGKLSNLSEMTEVNRNFARSEAQNVQACKHPNIIQLIETFEQNEQLLHIMEYADGGDFLTQVDARAEALARLLQTGPTPPGAASSPPTYFHEKEVLVILVQLCLAIRYLHNNRIMHRDLKTSNVLLMRSGLVKIGDFGFSRQYEEGVSAEVGKTFVGTPYYLAPELWQRRSYSYKADIWSLGVILYELLALQKPFLAPDMGSLMAKVLSPHSYDPLPPQRYSQEMRELVDSMLEVDPAARPTISAILASPLVRRNGLEYLKINIKRLKSIDAQVRDEIVRDIDEITSSLDTGSELSPHTEAK